MTLPHPDASRLIVHGELRADQLIVTGLIMIARPPRLEELPVLASAARRLGWVHEPPDTPMI